MGRDLYAELTTAVRRAGMRMGIFYEMEVSREQSNAVVSMG